MQWSPRQQKVWKNPLVRPSHELHYLVAKTPKSDGRFEPYLPWEEVLSYNFVKEWPPTRIEYTERFLGNNGEDWIRGAKPLKTSHVPW